MIRSGLPPHACHVSDFRVKPHVSCRLGWIDAGNGAVVIYTEYRDFYLFIIAG